MIETLVNRLSSRIISPDLSFQAILIAGILLGALPALDAQERLVPFVLFAVPAWYLYIVTMLYGFLRRPRTLDLGFVFGLEYAVRKRIARRFLVRKSIEIVAISSIAAVSFIGVHAAQFGASTRRESFGFGALLISTTLILFAVFILALSLGIFSPERHDPRPFWSFFRTGTGRISILSRHYYTIADSIGSLLPSSLSTILKRQLLYLMRRDLFGFALYNFAALAITGELLWMGRKEVGPIVTIGMACAPLFVCSVMTDAMSESASCAVQSGHYSFSRRDFFLVNLFIALAVAGPYIILYGIKRIFLTPSTMLVSMTNFGAFICAIFGIALSMANRWQRPAGDGKSLCLTFIAITSAMVGVAVPVWGVIISVLLTVILLLMLRETFMDS